MCLQYFNRDLCYSKYVARLIMRFMTLLQLSRLPFVSGESLLKFSRIAPQLFIRPMVIIYNKGSVRKNESSRGVVLKGYHKYHKKIPLKKYSHKGSYCLLEG